VCGGFSVVVVSCLYVVVVSYGLWVVVVTSRGSVVAVVVV
jgi:hypothetical protein